MLARPESKEMAKISGLRQDPEKAPICLGCHQTAYNAEDWEKDDSFWPEAGVQCETCHGPGSEYANDGHDEGPRRRHEGGPAAA